MRLTAMATLALLAGACSSSSTGGEERVAPDAGEDAGGARTDGGREAAGHDAARRETGTSADVEVDALGGEAAAASCSVDGEPGTCISTTACAALPAYESTPGYCPGPEDIECCRLIPNVADNPPTPAGYELMPQSAVTPAMTTWAVDILDDPTTYPLFSTATQEFGSLDVLARVEWHPPDFQNSAVHRGVTLYEPE
jgi:hypothetical protein